MPSETHDVALPPEMSEAIKRVTEQLELRDTIIAQRNAEIAALKSRLDRSFQCAHGRVIASCLGCDADASADLENVMRERSRALSAARELREVVLDLVANNDEEPSIVRETAWLDEVRP